MIEKSLSNNHQTPPFLKLFLYSLFFFIFLTGSISSASAQQRAYQIQGTISKIQVKGTKLIEKGLLYSTMSAQIGEKLSPRVVTNDIKALYKLGYFRDIQVHVEKDARGKLILTYQFLEKPRITALTIRGNEKISLTTLTEALSVHLYNMIDIKKVKKDVEAIQALYREEGLFRTKVSYQLKAVNNASIELTYIVEEAPKVYLTEINITGTKHFFPLDIKRLLQSGEVDCFSWMSSSTGVYDEARINSDLGLIYRHYVQNGFINIKINKPRIRLIVNPDYSKVIVDLHIEEGEQFYTGKIDIVSSGKFPLLFKKENLIKKMTLQQGEIFNPFQQNQDRFLISDRYLERGYAFSRVLTQSKQNKKKRTVDLTYKVIRNEKVYIRRVEIHGNHETRDYVVRRELKIHDNELYNGVKLRRSIRSITRLGYFTPGMGVQTKTEKIGSNTELDYNILLQETQTGTFTASLTYSETGGTSVILNVTKKNFLGRGQTVALSGEWSSKSTQKYNFTFTEPYLFGKKLYSSFNIFYQSTSDDYYDTLTQGFQYTLGVPVWNRLTTSLRYAYRDIDYLNADATGLLLLDNETVSQYRSGRALLSYSTVNNPQFPSDGSEISFAIEQVGGGLGGTEEYRQYDFTARYFQSLTSSKRVVFMAKYRGSVLEQSNPSKEISTARRFRIGGITTVRGFEYSEIQGASSTSETASGFSSTDLADASSDAYNTSDYTYYNTHVYGTYQSILNLELLFPLTREGQNMRGVIFFDAGNVWSENRMYEITGAKKDFGYYRKSIGAGIRLITPMGVLRFEYGTKLDKLDGESSGKFDFHISGLF
ncbi:MAG: outer membrane protein insertion porin family [bacterium]|jgi:outer membrane protein insertion porin family